MKLKLNSLILFGIFLSAVKGEENCTQTDDDIFYDVTKFTCPEDCCGSKYALYCCSKSNLPVGTNASCTKRNPADGTLTTINCANGCCGTENDRFCCNSSTTCTRRNSLLVSDTTVSTMACPYGCCGTEKRRYCCRKSPGNRYDTCIRKRFHDTDLTFTCDRGCCGFDSERYCCKFGPSEKRCITKDSPSSLTDYIICPIRCCGTELNRYCCTSGPVETRSASCTRQENVDGPETNLTCPNGCCGSHQFERYCCKHPLSSSLKTCYQRSKTNRTITTIQCYNDCCGTEYDRFCCNARKTTEGCTWKSPFDGKLTTISCPNGCCGTEETRYCCPPSTVSTDNGDKGCTKWNPLYDDSVTTLSCSSGCCGSELFRYCCQGPAASGLSTTLIIIISVVSVVVVAIIVGVVICCCCCCRRNSSGGGSPVVYGPGHQNAGYAHGNPGIFPGAPSHQGDYSNKVHYQNTQSPATQAYVGPSVHSGEPKGYANPNYSQPLSVQPMTTGIYVDPSQPQFPSAAPTGYVDPSQSLYPNVQGSGYTSKTPDPNAQPATNESSIGPYPNQVEGQRM